MSLKNNIKRVLNGLIRKGYWYNNCLFADCSKFWTYGTFNTDVINLGSTSALNAFCYEGLDIKGGNFALGHHPLSGDLAILRNYFSYLKTEGSTVIITLCPFSSLSSHYQCSEDRYYTLLYPSTMPLYSFRRDQQVKVMKAEPLNSYTIMGLLQDLKHLVIKSKNRQLNEEQMDSDAHRWVNSWLKEFSLRDFDTPLSLYNQDAIEDAAKILNKMVTFCKNHNIRPIIVIPPVYHTLGDLFSQKARTVIIDSMIEMMDVKGVWYHNYMDDECFTNNRTLFINSFLMNKKGAKLFTKRVLKDIGLL